MDEPFHVVGRLHRISDDPWSAGVQVWETKRSVTVPLNPGLKDQITRAWRHNETTLVRISGRASRDSHGYRRFREATGVSLIAGPSLSQRIEALATLQPGWLGEEAPAEVPPRRFLVRVERSLWGLIERTACDRPYLFLQPDASVEAVWKPMGKTITVRFGGGAVPEINAAAVDLERRALVRAGPVAALEQLDNWLMAQLGASP